ncbi:MAG: hypothetical protein LQ352_007377 [Teloschistes flavicans]|nr:MAG: hypothetical protein LQ352_007377 [Teloschistes flavicans]
MKANATVRIAPRADDNQSNNTNIVFGLFAILASVIAIWQGRRLLKSRRQESYELDAYDSSDANPIDVATPASANLVSAAPAPESPDLSGSTHG